MHDAGHAARMFIFHLNLARLQPLSSYDWLNIEYATFDAQTVSD
jgi:hypothetical protein